jgi:small ligand-binding sensory domain FIST
VNRFAAALSQHPLPAHAVGEVAGQVLDQLGGDDPDLVVCFASSHFAPTLDDAVHALHALLNPRVLIGTTAGGVLGGTSEVEGGVGLAVLAARVPDAEIEPVVLADADTPDGATVVGWPDHDVAADLLVLAADPFTFPTEPFLRRLAEDRPGLRVLGGLASGSARPGGNRLLADGRIVSDGAVGVLLGGVPVRTVVSQGCRPVGDPFVVTRGSRHFVEELAGRPALERLRDLADEADEAERGLLQRGLHLGFVVDEHRVEFGRGDFLVRDVLGADRETGAIAVNEQVEVGRTVQFHVRDAESADDDLRALLAGVPASAALVFTCNARGRGFFGVGVHDASVIAEGLGSVPTAGMFCAGELGPIGRRNALHAYTATLAVFE